MNKILLLVLSAFMCTFLHGREPEKVQALSAKVIISEEEGYYVLSDNSCWKIESVTPRWRTFSEWWNNAKLLPETFNCKPSDWDIAMPIEVYPKMGFPELPIDENVANKEPIAKCSHVFVNSRTRQILFATTLEIAHCVNQIYDAGHKEGYNSGHKTGYKKGHDSGHTEGYREGYTKGYDKGFSEGLKAQQNPNGTIRRNNGGI